jgi:hypothetical protein
MPTQVSMLPMADLSGGNTPEHSSNTCSAVSSPAHAALPISRTLDDASVAVPGVELLLAGLVDGWVAPSDKGCVEGDLNVPTIRSPRRPTFFRKPSGFAGLGCIPGWIPQAACDITDSNRF